MWSTAFCERRRARFPWRPAGRRTTLVAVDAKQTRPILERVAQAIRLREDELVARMLERFAAESPASTVGDDPDVTAAMRRSAHGNLRAALTLLNDGGSPLPFGPPAEAIEEARIAARARVPLVAGLQTYRIGQAVVWDAMLDAIDALDLDPATLSAVLRAGTHHGFAYVDAVVPHAVDEYTRERDRLLLSREQRRVQLVRDLLDGAHVEPGELGYDLAGRHRALIAWGPRADGEIARIAAALRAQPLVVALNGQTTWAWLGGGTVDDERSLRAALGEWPGGLALGRPATGPDGFRTSHREARAAHRIAAATGDPVTHFDDVALESAMLADEPAARVFVAAELDALGSGRDGGKLRETLSAYFACGFNASAAAAVLDVSDRTVAYRLNQIEDRLGRSVRTRQTELQAAIRLERVLGGASDARATPPAAG